MRSVARWALFLAASALVLPGAQAAPAEKAPDVIPSEDPQWPFWVSAEAAADPHTVLDWELMGDRSSLLLRDIVDDQTKKLAKAGLPQVTEDASPRPIPVTACESTLDSVDHEEAPRPSQTLDDLLQYSRAILHGVVRAVDFGFSAGMPTSLLTVEVIESLRGASETPARFIFVAHPVARFALGPYHFCNAERGFEPQVGDGILVFSYFGARDREGLLFFPRREQVFFERGSGLVLPERLRSDPALAGKHRLEEVVAKVRVRSQARRHP